MAGDLLAGGAVGIAFDKLLETVIHVTQTIASFNPSLDRLKSTLVSIKPVFDDIEKLNALLDVSKQETELFVNQLQQGVVLAEKCLKIKRFNYIKKYTHAKKLDDLEASLLRFFQVDVQARLYRNSQKVMVDVGSVDNKVDEILLMLKKNESLGGSKGFAGWCNVPGAPDQFVVGLDEPLRELKAMLLKEDGEQVVVLSAPGGCGKTTLAKCLCHDDKVKGIYGNNIFFITVSRSPNVKQTVQKIMKTQGLELTDLYSDEDAVNQLEQLLTKMKPKPVLLVLDDVWSESDWLIDDFAFPIPGYKILVTSRFVFPRFISTYKLGLLNDKEAMLLFCHSAFKDGVCDVPKHLVEKVVSGCGGFPMALKVVGKSLSRQPEVAWKVRLQKWSDGQSIFSTNNILLDRLLSTLDALEDVVLKECYMDLGLFPEDQRIPTMALLDIWVEMYGLDENGVYTFGYLHELATRNLVSLAAERNESSDGIDYCQEQFATQHDLLRDLAIHQSNRDPIGQRKRLILDIPGNNPPKWWTEQNQQPFHSRILSISTDETFSSNWFDDIQVPELEVLILNFRNKSYILPQSVERLRLLKVLIITNYGYSPAEVNNFSLLGNLFNLKRIRLEHVSIPLFSTSILQLQNLRKISLIACEIGKAFEDCVTGVPNMWPNLAEINIDYCDDLIHLPALLCNLINLKKLSITYCQELVSLPEEIGNLVNLEMLRLHSCTKLPVLPESIGSLQKLKILCLSDCVEISNLPTEIGDLCALEKIDMRGCTGIDELPPSVMNLLRLEVICDEETANLWEPYLEYMDNWTIRALKKIPSLHWLHNINASLA